MAQLGAWYNPEAEQSGHRLLVQPPPLSQLLHLGLHPRVTGTPDVLLAPCLSPQWLKPLHPTWPEPSPPHPPLQVPKVRLVAALAGSVSSSQSYSGGLLPELALFGQPGMGQQGQTRLMPLLPVLFLSFQEGWSTRIPLVAALPPPSPLPGCLAPDQSCPQRVWLFSFIQQMGQAVLDLPSLPRVPPHLEEPPLTSGRPVSWPTTRPQPSIMGQSQWL